MAKNKESKLKKEDFIKMLSQMSKEEMNDYIRQKGKPKKMVSLYYIFNRDSISKN